MAPALNEEDKPNEQKPAETSTTSSSTAAATATSSSSDKNSPEVAADNNETPSKLSTIQSIISESSNSRLNRSSDRKLRGAQRATQTPPTNRNTRSRKSGTNSSSSASSSPAIVNEMAPKQANISTYDNTTMQNHNSGSNIGASKHGEPGGLTETAQALFPAHLTCVGDVALPPTEGILPVTLPPTEGILPVTLPPSEDILPSLFIPDADAKELSVSVDSIMPTFPLDNANMLEAAHDDSGSSLAVCDELTNFQLRISTSSEEGPTLSGANMEQQRTYKSDKHEVMSVHTESTVTASETGENIGDCIQQYDNFTSNQQQPPIGFEGLHIEESTNLVISNSSLPTTSSTATAALHHQTEIPKDIFEVANAFQQAALHEPPHSVSQLQHISPIKFRQNQTEIDVPDLVEMLQSLGSVNATESLGDINLNAILNEVYTDYHAYTEPSNVLLTNNAPLQHPGIIAEPPPPVILAPTLEEIRQQQQDIDSLLYRHDSIQKRVRRLQALKFCQHISSEVAGIFEFAARISKPETHTEEQRAFLAALRAGDFNVNVSDRPNPDAWNGLKETPMSLIQTRKFLQLLENSARKKMVCKAINKHVPVNPTPPKKIRGRPGQANSSTDTSFSISQSQLKQSYDAAKELEVVPNLDLLSASELKHVFGLTQAGAREVQMAYDSEATDSSSGAESADEFSTYNNETQQPLPIKQRAAWRYSRQRAGIAQRWTYLRGRINDLEVKIHKYNGIKKELAAKTHNKAFELFDKHEHKHEFESHSELLEDRNQVSRTMPLSLVRRKRKSFISLKEPNLLIKVPNNAKCSCYTQSMACALCLGRADPTAPRAPTQTLPLLHRFASVDAGFHPKIGMLHDVRWSVQINGICRQADWQNRVIRMAPKSIYKQHLKAEREAANANAASRKAVETRRRYVRKKIRPRSNKDSVVELSAIDGGDQAQDFGNDADLSYKSKRPRMNVTNETNVSEGNYSISDQSGPLPKGMARGYDDQQFNQLQEQGEHLEQATSASNNRGKTDRLAERRAQRPSFDIDNIVIPHSVAASTRPELLTYSDILTPSWRVVDGVLTEINGARELNSFDDISAKWSQNAPPSMHTSTPKPRMPQAKTVTALQASLRKLDALMEASESCLSEQFKGNTRHCGDNGGTVASTSGTSSLLATSFEANAPPAADTLFNGNKTTTFDALPSQYKDHKDIVHAQVPQTALPPEVVAELSELEDSTILARHYAALAEEKLKHSNIYPYKTRARIPRLSESKPTSSGGNTPNPGSPAPPAPACDNPASQGVPSPLIQAGSTQPAFGASVDNASLDSYASQAMQHKSNNQRFSPPGFCAPVAPYEPIKFPLADDEYQRLMSTVPCEPLPFQFNIQSRIDQFKKLQAAVRDLNKRRRDRKGGPSGFSSAHRASLSRDELARSKSRGKDGCAQRASRTTAQTLSKHDIEYVGSDCGASVDDEYDDMNLLVPSTVEEHIIIGAVDQVCAASQDDDNMDTSDLEDFEMNGDDDPHDPEWGRGRRKPRSRSERSRRAV